MIFRSLSLLALSGLLTACVDAQGWLCYAGNAQHTGEYTGTSQTAGLIKWQAPLQSDGNGGVIHYAAPMVTPSNTVVYGYRYTTGSSDYDNWSVIARSAATGATVWQLNTDYSAAIINPNGWTTVFPITLFQTSAGSSARGVAAAASGGSIMVRTSADAKTSTPKRLVFYTTLADFTKNQSAYAPIKINTPITADTSGNLYFGYEVTGTVPSTAASLGTGGIAKISVTTGKAIYQSVAALKVDYNLTRAAMNCAPVLTPDNLYVYGGFTGSDSQIVKMETKNLSPVAHVLLQDPSIAGANTYLDNSSSGSPMIAPDGHVFVGVFGNQYRESHGWMLQFDENLNQNEATGNQLPVGSFGWDNTPSVVPSKIVPSYTGAAKYLILTKYNNYDYGSGDGSNKVAVLDPTSNSISTDRQSGIPVMNEIITILGPLLTNDDPNHPNARFEWCINSSAIDIDRKSAILNSEDGHLYRWSFVSNSVTESQDLQPPTGEAYTETAIGPDGQIYAINNSVLFAIGSNKATAVSVKLGKSPKGNVSDLWYLDGENYTVQSALEQDQQLATVEVDFTLASSSATTLNIAGSASGPSGSEIITYAYNYKTKQFDNLGFGVFNSSVTNFNLSVSSNAKQYIGPGGKVRLELEAEQLANTKFTFSVDYLTCGLVSN